MKNLKEYEFSYYYDGAKYVQSIIAYTKKEAEERMRAMTNAVYEGKVLAKIDLEQALLCICYIIAGVLLGIVFF